VLGTRASPLALWQARHVAARLEEVHPGTEIELRTMRTEGDEQQTRPLSPDDRGVFVRRIEAALLSGKIDLAVHSLKDLPTEQPEGLVLAAVPKRHDPRDAILSSTGFSLATLPQSATVGTGSPRRRTQLLSLRPDLRVQGLRGNVDTRVRRLEQGGLDAIVLAVAGVERLGITQVASVAIDVDDCIPAVGQGAIVIETRADDRRTQEIVGALEDEPTRIAVESERAFLRRLGGGCLAPAAAHASVAGQQVRIRAVVGGADDDELLRREATAEASASVEAALELAERMLEDGAARLLQRAREAAG
jgi:hydroxymethylbilane synthase